MLRRAFDHLPDYRSDATVIIRSDTLKATFYAAYATVGCVAMALVFSFLTLPFNNAKLGSVYQILTSGSSRFIATTFFPSLQVRGSQCTVA